MSNMSNLIFFFIVAVRKVAAGHRMVAEGWKMFEEALEEGAPGDLPALLRHLKGKTMPPPPTPIEISKDTQESAPSPSPAKKVKMWKLFHIQHGFAAEE